MQEAFFEQSHLAPEIDGEIRYFVERVILTDPSYLRAAKEAMEIDPDARSRLFESSAIMERLVRNTLIGAYEDQACQRSLPALTSHSAFGRRARGHSNTAVFHHFA